MRERYAGGWSGLTFPKELGGRGASGIEAVIFAEEEGKYPLPKGPFTSIGTGMALPVIAKHGTAEQKARFIEATLKGDITWCQLFSEPAAGSDLAGLRTKASRSEEHTSELQSLMRIAYAVFCLKNKKTQNRQINQEHVITGRHK